MVEILATAGAVFQSRVRTTAAPPAHSIHVGQRICVEGAG